MSDMDCYCFFCPNCDEDLKVPQGQDKVTCPECKKTWLLNFDYSFDEGSWRNCTTTTEVKT